MPPRGECLRCGGPVEGDHPSARRGICLPCAATPPASGPTRLLPGAGGESAPAAPAPAVLPGPGTDLGGLVVEGPLGRGGMGALLVARESALDRRVAVKFLREDLAADPGHASRFLKEGQSLAQVSHPHVVRVHRLGEWEGRPFLVMELVEGRPLAREIPAAGMPPEEALRIAGELASALAAVHERSIVHRDVNPNNCLLREGDRSLCLIDFGIARRLDRSTGSGGQIAGTMHYTAPEQLFGGRVDARADVYSFGATLFEMISGSPPFHGLETPAFLDAVRRRDPPLLRDLRPGTPREVETLVARCLARSPEFRPASGAALLDHLRGGPRAAPGTPPLSAADRVAERPPTLPEAPAEEPEETPLLGRAGEMEAASSALEDAAAGRGSLLLVEGTAGSGKSRLLREFARAARARAMSVLSCPGGEYPASPRAAFRAMILAHGAAAGLADPAELASFAFASIPDRAPLRPALLWFLRGEPPSDAAPPARTALRRAVLALLHAFAARRPVLLLAEDLHRLDEGSLDLLAAAAAECASWPLVVAGSHPPAEETPRRALDGWLAGVLPLPRTRRLPLAPLDEAAVADLALRILGLPREEALRMAPGLHRRSGGNPLYVVESLRVLRQEGAEGREKDRRRTRGRASSMSLPPPLQEVASRRIAGLPAAEREALAVVSVDPRGVPSTLVGRCLGLDRLPVLRTLQRLAREHGLLAESGGAYRVTHEGIRQSVYDGLLPELRAQFHGEAAAALAAGGAGGGGGDPERVGMHLLLAGRPAEAAPLLLETAERLARGGSHGDARELLDRLLAGPASPDLRGARRLRARVLRDCGEVEEAGRELEALVADGSGGAEDLLEYADHLWSLEDAPGTTAALDRADLLPLSGEQRLRAALLRSMILDRKGDAAGAVAALDGVAAEAGRSPPGLRLRWLAARGATLWRHGRAPAARDCYREALLLAEGTGDQDRAAGLLQNLAVVAEDLGDLEDALSCAERAAERSATFGSERSEARARLLLADCQVRCQRLEEAAATLDRAEPMVESLGAAMSLAMLHSRRLEIALARGDAAEALRRADAILAAAGGFPAVAAGALLYRAKGLLLAGRAGEALAAAREARAAFLAQGDPESAEEALAAGAAALRAEGREGPEREGARALGEPLTVEGAIEAFLEADEGRRGALRAAAERLARSPWDRALVRRRLGRG